MRGLIRVELVNLKSVFAELASLLLPRDAMSRPSAEGIGNLVSAATRIMCPDPRLTDEVLMVPLNLQGIDQMKAP